MCCSCGGADSRARHCTGETNEPSLKWQMPKYGAQRRSRSALYRDIQPHKGAGAPRATLMCHCEERSDVAISGRHSQIVQAAVKTYRPIASVAALTERLVQGYSTAQGHWCTARHPDVSLRGAKRRGNLAVPGRITGHSRRKRNCLHEIATGAKRPRNDKSGAIAVLAIACANRQCSAGSGMPLPYNKGTIDSAPQKSKRSRPGGRLLPCPHQRTGIFWDQFSAVR